MSMKQFCKTLKKCAEKLEEDIKYNINDFHNKFFGNNMTETKLALERAKDYHYKELIDSIAVILKNIEIIIFHQDKIEWLAHEENFTADDLKRFSYVKRQVFAFSKKEEKPNKFSRSEENLAVSQKNISKRERRRTASEISLDTLEAWEKYLDQKEEVTDNIEEIKQSVPKRTLSNARARKKFVSSTVGGFLDYEERRRNLDSIVERSSFDERNDFNKIVEDVEESMMDSNNKTDDIVRIKSTIEDDEEDEITIESAKTNLSSGCSDGQEIDDTSLKVGAIREEIVENPKADITKPKIVDVLYKKKPSI